MDFRFIEGIGDDVDCVLCGVYARGDQFLLLPSSEWLHCCRHCRFELEKKYKNRQAVEKGARAMQRKATKHYDAAWWKLVDLGLEKATLAECATALNQVGIKTSRGGDYSAMAVKRLFESKAKEWGWKPGDEIKARDFIKQSMSE